MTEEFAEKNFCNRPKGFSVDVLAYVNF